MGEDFKVVAVVKFNEEEANLKAKNKRDALISNLLIGRSMLLRAIEHAKNWQRYMDLTCSLEGETDDHIGLWKKAIKEHQSIYDGLCDEEMFEVLECPKCSNIYAGYKARRIMKAKLGTINGILTRMGNNMRGKE